MARKVFFSFHYDNDINRAMVVRNCWLTQGVEEAGFIDKVDFEKIQKQGEDAIHKWIDEQMIGTSVTVILIGEDTLNRPYIQYEIRKSIKKGNGIVGVKIHNIQDMKTRQTSPAGDLHTQIGVWSDTQQPIYFDEIAHEIHDYITENGYNNIGAWIGWAADKTRKQ